MIKFIHNYVGKAVDGAVIKDLVEGWSFTLEEKSNNAYLVRGWDTKGNSFSDVGYEPNLLMSESVLKALRLIARQKLPKGFIEQIWDWLRSRRR